MLFQQNIHINGLFARVRQFDPWARIQSLIELNAGHAIRGGVTMSLSSPHGYESH